jgi:hypothetical protein
MEGEKKTYQRLETQTRLESLCHHYMLRLKSEVYLIANKHLHSLKDEKRKKKPYQALELRRRGSDSICCHCVQ